IAWASFAGAPSWQLMWAVTIAIYAGCKWLSFATCHLRPHASAGRSLAYLLLWPGMNASKFLDSRLRPEKPAFAEWIVAAFKFIVGLVLLFSVVRRVTAGHAILRGWIGLTGLLLVFHFGLFHLLSLIWRSRGIVAEPILN